MKKSQVNIGDIIGTNLIIEKDIDKTFKTKRSYYKCKCILCNNIRSVRSDSLNSKCRSCAAKNRISNDAITIMDSLIDKKFGYWQVINKAKKPNYWVCKCTCPNCKNNPVIKEIFRGSLTQGMSKSCGSIKSWGETQIKYCLDQYNIPYKVEYTFPDLITDKNGKPRFDFALLNTDESVYCLIEYDGRQHQTFQKNWNHTLENFNRLQYIDELKNEYCKIHNIPLYRLNKNDNIENKIKEIKEEYYGF